VVLRGLFGKSFPAVFPRVVDTCENMLILPEGGHSTLRMTTLKVRDKIFALQTRM
jgi:hypothetical protein